MPPLRQRRSRPQRSRVAHRAPAPDRLSDTCERLGATLIHQMRHPLLGIKGGLELLTRSANGDSPDLRMVQGQVARLEELLRTYQQLFSHEPIERVAFAVAPAARRAVELLQYRLGGLGMRFSLAEDPDATGFGSPGALVHALMNVIANALDALEESGGLGRLAVRVLAPGGCGAEVRVSDEGPGIAPRDRSRIFSEGFTTKPAGRGMGLGLPIARTLMTRSGGDVRLVGAGDPLRLPWSTELAISLPPPPK